MRKRKFNKARTYIMKAKGGGPAPSNLFQFSRNPLFNGTNNFFNIQTSLFNSPTVDQQINSSGSASPVDLTPKQGNVITNTDIKRQDTKRTWVNPDGSPAQLSYQDPYKMNLSLGTQPITNTSQSGLSYTLGFQAKPLGLDQHFEQQNQEQARGMVQQMKGSTSSSEQPTPTNRNGNIAQVMDHALNISQNLMYAIGANQNDSKGTTIARGAVAGAAEIASQLPPPANIAGPILKGINLADSILDKAHVGKYNDNFSIDEYAFEKVGGSYGSTLNKANEAKQLSGQRHGFLGIGGRKARNRDNAKIAEAKRQQSIMASIANENDDLKNGAEAMSDINHIHNSIFLSGGYDPLYARAAKEGGVLEPMSFDNFLQNISEDISFLDFIKNNPQELKEGGSLEYSLEESFEQFLQNTQDELDFSEYLIETYKNGGLLTSPNNIESNQVNVIPEGALHKNKHNLKTVGFDDSEITKKGIPVLDEQGNQQAEIELNEIIFSLEVTKFLEENYENYYDGDLSESKKEELLINVGKEMVYQILENTKDNTGLIEVAKDGTSLQLKNTTLVNDNSSHSFQNEDTDPKNSKLKQNIEDEDIEFNPYIQEFINTAESLNYPPNYIENMLVHCIKESSWKGNDKQTKNNFSNIHVSKNWKGLVHNGTDTNASGTSNKTQFKDYNTMEEFIKDHDDTLKRLYEVTQDDDFDAYIDKINGNNKYKFYWTESPTYKKELQDVFKKFRKNNFQYYIY